MFRVKKIEVISALILSLATGFVHTANALPVTAGLVGYWSGDENANDTSGLGNDGILHGGVSYTTGVFGQAFLLDGQNGWISTSQTFADDQSHTISAWVNWNGQTSSDFQEIVGWWEPSIFPISSRMFLGTAQQVGQGPIRYGDGWNSVNVSISQNQWVHILATYDGLNNSRNIYLDGILVDSLNSSAEAKFFNLSIGRQGTLNGEYWNGAIDELALFDRVLNANEINALASPSAVPVPAALWLFGSSLLGLVGLVRRKKA